MVLKRRKIDKPIYGGHKIFKKPAIFSGEKIKNKKEVKIPKNLWKIILYIFITLVVLYYLFFSSKFIIKEVIISGNGLVSNERINSYIPSDANIFRTNTEKIKQVILRENPEIKNIEIIRGIPNALKIVVLEHENKVIWQTKDNKYLVSSQGIISKKINSVEEFLLPVVVDSKGIDVNEGESIVSPDFIVFIINVRENFFDYTNIKPTNFEVSETTFDVNLHTEAGFYVKFNTLRASYIQLENLKKVLVAKRPEIVEYVDLRVDGWAYYK